MIVRSYAEADRGEVVALWRRCDLVRPWNDPGLDIDRKLVRDPELLLVAEGRDQIVGTIMAGYDGHRGWLNYLGVAPDHRGTGLGRMLVAEAEVRLGELGCPKINLQIRADNTEAVGFYRRLGYVVDEVIGMGRRLVED